MFTNNDWAVPASEDERRYFVLEIDSKYLDVSPEESNAYFSSLNEEFENGGLAAMLYDLLHAEPLGIDLRRPPRTDALAAQKMRSLKPQEKWWRDVVMDCAFRTEESDGDHPEWETSPLIIGKNDIFDSYRSALGRARGVVPSNTELGMFLRKNVPGLTEHRTTGETGRLRVLTFPPCVELRKAFVEKYGLPEDEWLGAPKPHPATRTTRSPARVSRCYGLPPIQASAGPSSLSR